MKLIGSARRLSDYLYRGKLQTQEERGGGGGGGGGRLDEEHGLQCYRNNQQLGE